MPNNKKQPQDIQQTAIGDGNVQVAGDNNTVNVNQTFGQKIINVFKGINIFFVKIIKGDNETLDQRNRRIMLNHVENFWVKGILEKSLHGAALLELGIKEDPDALNYPWAIKREATKELLSAGLSMLEIFQEIGMGRSLLILGAPGSGKTTMLLELARQLIEHARNDEIEPIPVVFNLASWNEKQTLADWLAEQLNIVYYVPAKTAPGWINENRMHLLLDGFDEVRADRRFKCVEAINQFRKEHGLIAVVVCSRSEGYSVVKTKLLFDGAISLQPLSSEQIDAYFDQFDKSLAGVKELIKQDQALEELAETPLMLSVMTLAYQGKEPSELVRSGNSEERRKHLFDTYMARMFERSTRTANTFFTKQQVLHYLSWLAGKMIQHNLSVYQIEAIQPAWLEDKQQIRAFKLLVGLLGGLIFGLSAGLIFGLLGGPSSRLRLGLGLIGWLLGQPSRGLSVGLIFGLFFGLFGGQFDRIKMVDKLTLSWTRTRGGLIVVLIYGLSFGLLSWLIFGLVLGQSVGPLVVLIVGLICGLSLLEAEEVAETTSPGQRLKQTLANALYSTIIFGLLVGLLFGLLDGPSSGLSFGLLVGLVGGLSFGFNALLRHYTLRWMLVRDHYLPRQLIAFLDYCVDLIFLRRVGGGYIFVHRLLMEHFAAMYSGGEKSQ